MSNLQLIPKREQIYQGTIGTFDDTVADKTKRKLEETYQGTIGMQHVMRANISFSSTVNFFDKWQKVFQEMISLLSMEENWDSYGSPPISRASVERSMGLLLLLNQSNLPAPSVVPTSKGGIQLEWHIKGIDLEIELNPQANIHIFSQERNGSKEWELASQVDLENLKKVIISLAV